MLKSNGNFLAFDIVNIACDCLKYFETDKVSRHVAFTYAYIDPLLASQYGLGYASSQINLC